MPNDNETVSQNLDADFNNSSGSKRDVLRILYVFSGKSRKGSVSHWCKKLAKRFSITVEVEMIDIKVRPHLDLTNFSEASNGELSCYHTLTPMLNIQSSSLVEQERTEAGPFLCPSSRSSEINLE